MTAPVKPWERVGVNNSQLPSCCQGNNMAGQPPGIGGVGIAGGGVPLPTATGAPPPLPTRPTQQYGNRYSTLGGYGGMYSPYSSSMYNSYGGMYNSPYSMYGGYGGGMGYNRFGYGANENGEFDGFARIAEESSRPAFQSIESIVNAFTSVSMMLDSTFQAVYNSFRAVIGVADNFSRLKLQLANVFSAFALFRFLRYLYRKLLVLLRLREPGYAEEAWTQASDVVSDMAAATGDGNGKKSTWPIMMFFGMILGAPWLIWKLVGSINKKQAIEWASGDADHFVAQALHNFKGENQNELSFKTGQYINVAPKELQPKVKGWLLACVDGKKTGLIPANYVKVLGKRRGRKSEQYIEANNPSMPCCESKSEAAQSSEGGQLPVPTNEEKQLSVTFSDIQNEESLDNTFQNVDMNQELNTQNETSQVNASGDHSQMSVGNDPSLMNAEDILNESED